jgi:predicted acylesterase/phospholipase RssA
VCSGVNSQKICQALCLQGSADQGPYQAGAFKSLVANTPAGQTSYDIITGVGVGAINTFLLSQFPQGQEASAASWLENFWASFQSSDYYKGWTFGPAQGFLTEAGMYDNSKAAPFLESKVSGSGPVRSISIGVCNADDASYWTFNNFNGALAYSTLAPITVASYAIPGIFPYYNYQGATFIDGSTMKNLDIAAAVDQCRVLNGNIDSNINIDIIMTTTKSWNLKEPVTNQKSLYLLQLTLEITNFRTTQYDIQKAQWDYPNVNFRYLVSPSSALPTQDAPFGYSSDQQSAMFSQGESDALNAIQQGEGQAWNSMVDTISAYLNNTFGTGAKLQDDEYHQQLVQTLKTGFQEEYGVNMEVAQI